MEIITAVENYHALLTALQAADFEVEHSHITMHAQTTIPMDKDTADSFLKLIDTLEDLDDVQEVYSNAEYTESMMA